VNNIENKTTTNTNKFIDLVIAGPDFSGTTTQISNITEYFKTQKLRVRDLRGTEIDALFHAMKFSDINSNYSSLKEMLEYKNTTDNLKIHFFEEAYNLLSGKNNAQDLLVASMINNDCTTYISPNSADVWILEEPTRRSAGQVCRVIEQNSSKFGSQVEGFRAALAHQAYRTDEFLRFRKPLRDKNKIILRSRSEESACYQIFDEKTLRSGIKLDDYLNLPGHKIAFANPPTDIFVVCGPENWDKDSYLELKEIRVGTRIQDDHEKDYFYQLLVNNRYASTWLEELYQKGCQKYNSKEPTIHRFNIYHTKGEIRREMNATLDIILTNKNIK
jgi:thymidylate kinase